MIDPVTLYLAKKGVEKFGPYARDWIKGDTTRQLVASLAATVEPEEDFELINFASLEADAAFRALVDQVAAASLHHASVRSND